MTLDTFRFLIKLIDQAFRCTSQPCRTKSQALDLIKHRLINAQALSTPETDLHTATNSYTIKEAALVVGRSELTIRRRIDKGRFPGAEMHPGADLAKVAKEELLGRDVQSLTDQAATFERERDQARSDLEYTKTELGFCSSKNSPIKTQLQP